MTTIRKIQLTGLDILMEVVRICDEQNLTYFLIEGTLLGAIRHQGFIPWDDDIDIGMPREDYKKFLAICERELGKRFTIQYQENEPQYCLPFAKVRMKNTVYEEKDAPKGLREQGFWIDIFPLDYSKRVNALGQKFKNWFLLNLLKLAEVQSIQQKSLKKRAASRICKIFHINQRRLLNLYSRIAHSKERPYLVNHGSFYRERKETMPTDWYFPAVKVEFEGHLFSVPCQSEKVLQNVYGNYMQLPPEEKRVPRHDALKIQFEDGSTESIE